MRYGNAGLMPTLWLVIMGRKELKCLLVWKVSNVYSTEQVIYYNDL